MRVTVGGAVTLIILGIGYCLYHAGQVNNMNATQTATKVSDPNTRTINDPGSEPIVEHKYRVTGEVVTAQTCYGQSEQLMLEHTKYGDAIECFLEEGGDGCSHTSTLKALDPVDVIIHHHVATRHKTATVTGWAADADDFPRRNERLEDCQIVNFSSKLGPPEDGYGNKVTK